MIRTRSGDRFKPSALRAYEDALRRFVDPAVGSMRLSSITRNRVQDLVDELTTRGYAPSTVANAISPLRAVFRRALDREEVSANPTLKIAMPKDRRRREKVADPREMRALLAALPDAHRPLWSCAAYAGLRRGELQALRWSEVDLEAQVLHVVASWDRVAGLVAPKSRAGERTVPLPSVLRAELAKHRLRQGRGGEGFVFAISSERPFDPPNTLRIAKRVWREHGLEPVGFHELRHAYASFAIAAGVNAKALSTYLGHSSIQITLDRYGHLFPGNEQEAASLLDSYFEMPANGGWVVELVTS